MDCNDRIIVYTLTFRHTSLNKGKVDELNNKTRLYCDLAKTIFNVSLSENINLFTKA